MEFSDALDRTLQLFGVGAALDFIISRFRWSIWRWSRRLWNAVAGIYLPHFHRAFARRVLALWEKLNTGDKDTREVMVAFVGCLFALLAAAAQLRVGPTDIYLEILGATVVLALGLGYFLAMLVALNTRRVADFLNNKLSPNLGVWFGLTLIIPVAAILLVATLGLLGPAPQGWKIATMGLIASVYGDVLSVRVTLFVLRWVSTKGPLLGLLGAVADSISAFVLTFITAIGIVIGTRAPNLLNLLTEASVYPAFIEEPVGAYMGILQFTAFVPTIILWIVFSTLCLMKLAQATLQKTVLTLLDLAADPIDEGRALPFTMLAFVFAVLIWCAELFNLAVVTFFPAPV